MPRKNPEHPPVMRTDLLPSNLTTSKAAKVLDLLAAYRRGAVLLGREQWRLFFETGRFAKNHSVNALCPLRRSNSGKASKPSKRRNAER